MLLEMRQGSFAYGRDREIFGHVDLTLEEGDVLCLLGPNGAGKSTLLHCLDGILPLSKGEILLSGKPLVHLSRRQISQQVAFLPQFHRTSFPFRVLDIVLMGRTPHLGFWTSPGKRDEDRAREALHALDILHLSDSPYTQISGGERQLVLLASALVQEPRLLLLDEPTSHLDFGNQARFLQIVNRLARQGMAIVMTTHFPDHALLTASKVILLKDGRTRGGGDPVETLTESLIGEIYGIKVRLVHLEAEDIRTCVPLLSAKAGQP
ncbi:MAG: ABC transporter ATP-binding protein [Synergistaceae bacterium]|nr:ABC transporter ATP-binding protein [Synergistaceae bacterium]